MKNPTLNKPNCPMGITREYQMVLNTVIEYIKQLDKYTTLKKQASTENSSIGVDLVEDHIKRVKGELETATKALKEAQKKYKSTSTPSGNSHCKSYRCSPAVVISCNSNYGILKAANEVLIDLMEKTK